MSKVALGILTGILIFIAAGILATYWVGKMRRDMEQKKPRLAYVASALPRCRAILVPFGYEVPAP
jgi:hypothetical protein